MCLLSTFIKIKMNQTNQKNYFQLKDLSDKMSSLKTSRFSCNVMNKLYYICKGFLFTDCCVDSYKSEYFKSDWVFVWKYLYAWYTRLAINVNFKFNKTFFCSTSVTTLSMLSTPLSNTWRPGSLWDHLNPL